MPTIRIDGRDQPVTQAWYDATIAPYPELVSWSAEQIDAKRRALADKSNVAPWTDAERAQVQALDRVWNAHNATRLLHGRDHRDFGFEGVDQVHHNSSDYACGCTLAHVYDHHHQRAIAAAVEHESHIGLLERARKHGNNYVIWLAGAAHDRSAAHLADTLAHAKLDGADHREVMGHQLRHHQHGPHRICAYHAAPATPFQDLDALREAVNTDNQALAEFHAMLADEAAEPKG